MSLRITPKKKIALPPITCIYGEPGVGKSTFAASAPQVVFLCVEQGTDNIAVSRARLEDPRAPDGERDPGTYEEFTSLLESLGSLAETGKAEFKHVAIDTVDALEKLVHQHICRTGGKRSIADFRFGLGYDLAVDAFRATFTRLERLKRAGIGVILIAHHQITTFNNPEGANFDRYDLKLHKKVAGLVFENCSNVLFARREQYALEEHGKVRGVAGGSRFIHTQNSPAFVAKNRYDLPEKLALRWSDYAAAVEAHRPADPEETRRAALSVIAQFADKDTQSNAARALDAISNDSPEELVRFLDYCRSKLEIAQPTETQKPATKTEEN